MLWFDAPAQASDQERVANQRRDALRSRELHFHLGAMNGDNNLPTLIGKLKIDWLDFPVDDILQQFTTLKEGILRGVFKQKQLVPGLAVVQKRPKSGFFSQGTAALVSGLVSTITC